MTSAPPGIICSSVDRCRNSFSLEDRLGDLTPESSKDKLLAGADRQHELKRALATRGKQPGQGLGCGGKRFSLLAGDCICSVVHVVRSSRAA